MQFLSPIWFFALAALSIPIVIHLWNIKPGKTLKVGSISLISEASKTNRRSFKLVDILLFILRCLLLGLLAFFLAAPVWQHLRSTEKVKGWVLLPKENLKESYQKFKPAIDSLTRAGYEFHYFESGFAKGDLTKILADTNHRDTAPANNYWGLVKQLNNKVSSALPVYVFTPNGSNHFNGAKPATGLNLHWQTYTTADSVSKWIATASFTANNTIKVTQGNGNPAGTYYTEQFIKDDGNQDIDVKVQNGLPVVSFKNSEHAAVQVDTSTLRIAIYTDKYALDAGYLKAALSAVVNFTGRKASIRQYNNPAQIPGGQEWLFWLSDEPVSSDLLNSSKNIFKYENGKVASTASWIDAGDALFNANKKIALNKLIASVDKNEPVWNDGFGTPVLDKKTQKKTNIYRFYTRFNPNWNDLVWSDDFPKMILKLINYNSYQQPEKFDKRILTNQQIQPIQIKQTTGVASTNPAEQVDLSKYFWLLVVALFIAERILSHKTKTIPTNG
ncbi:BatA domain-containing protein [Mucilaginibacter sp.]|jgi:hypothetical protein|uniref:BatA domain-containing protein n=1 Tax=Mucilaginibacter sp. TaxID=1882438 RepID=UPI003562D4AE